jgi:hypothetical protein
LRYDVLGDFAQLVADGQFMVPVARTFALDEWGLARDISQSALARDKLVLLLGGLAAGDQGAGLGTQGPAWGPSMPEGLCKTLLASGYFRESFTIAKISALIESGSRSHALTTMVRSKSLGQGSVGKWWESAKVELRKPFPDSPLRTSLV